MNHKQMRKRCPDSEFLGRALLTGYTFVYDGFSSKRKGAIANIVQAGPNSETWGGLFEISIEDLSRLDKYEGYPVSYNRKKVMVKDERGRSREATAYYRTGNIPGKSAREYRNVVIQGAGDCGLPEQYITENLQIS